MSYRLGVDVGGTFTDLLLVDEKTGKLYTAKVPSTPDDASIGVFNGIERVCDNADIDPNEITSVMHGTTIATNTILTGTGAKVGLVTTQGYRQVLQIARSFVPGGLGGWVIYNKSNPLAPLALTIEAVSPCLSYIAITSASVGAGERTNFANLTSPFLSPLRHLSAIVITPTLRVLAVAFFVSATLSPSPNPSLSNLRILLSEKISFLSHFFASQGLSTFAFLI